MQRFYKSLLPALALLCACYSPDYPEGRTCAPDGSCPGDLMCDQFFQCLSPEFVDVTIPPDPPFPPEFPPDAYGLYCLDEAECEPGLSCYRDPLGINPVGFCTPVCGGFDGAIRQEICDYVDPGNGMTSCGLVNDPQTGGPPIMCSTFCEGDQVCPPGLECLFTEAWGAFMCQPPF